MSGALSGIKEWLRSEIFIRRLQSPVGLTLLALLAIGAGYLAANDLSILVFVLSGALAGGVIVYMCMFRPLQGYYIVTLVAYFAFYPTHILNKEIPLSTLTEVLILFLFMGGMWSTRGDANAKGNLFRTGISILLLINVAYFIMELFNPNMSVQAGWFFSSKRYLVYILFFIISYRLINTPAKFRFFFRFWVFMAVLGGAYACYQQWFGYLPMELAYIKSDPHEYGLLFQGGQLRKYSFFDGVVTSGILCGSFAVITLILAVEERTKRKRVLLIFSTIFLFLGMLYSGTRTTTIMLPTGIALYSLMTIRNRKTLVTVFVFFVFAAFLMIAPINSPTLNRMRSTFNKQDASLNVRDMNRKMIQPYIYQNPLGGGVAASGVEGMRFNPSHPLAGFPPDSGFLKIALDMGYVGLFLTVLMYLAILYTGIQNYHIMRNERYKKYTICITAALFSIMVTQYSQVSIGQIPNALFFYAAIALFQRMLEFDRKERLSFRNSPVDPEN